MKKNVRTAAVFGLLLFVHNVASVSSGEFDALDTLADSIPWEFVIRSGIDVTPQDVLDFIAAPPLLLQDRLQNNLYLFTSPANQRRRSLLDYPFNYLHDYCLPECGVQGNAYLFANITNLDNYTEAGTRISSYWNLNDENLIGDIDEEDFGINIPDAIALFCGMIMQESRAGFMASAFGVWDSFNAELRTLFYYNERNFNVSAEERARIEQSNFFDEDNSGTTSHQELNRHFIGDAFGLGDTRICGGCFLVDQENFGLNVGALMTLPTAFAFERGLLGSDFDKNSCHAPFDLLSLFQLALSTPPNTQAVVQTSIDFLISAFDKLSANLLQVTMGNGGHIGTGFFFENYLPLNERFKITTRGEIEYLFPSSEKRFYITKKFPQEFTALEPYTTEDGADPAQAPAKLAFLNMQLIDTFIPKVYTTSIYPGFILRFASELSGYFGQTWMFGIGYDLWWQDKERLGPIKANPLQIANIRTDIATRPGAFQNKIFGTVSYYHQYSDWFDWCLTTYADYTVLSSGIGRDYTISFRFTAQI
jgi:hypothetical protein